MSTVFNWLMVLLGFLGLSAFGFYKDEPLIIIPALMFSGYLTAALIDVIINEWEK